MFVTNIHKEKAAKKALEFYGFWLWNYTEPLSYCLDDDKDWEEPHLIGEFFQADGIVPKYDLRYNHETDSCYFDVPPGEVAKQNLESFRNSLFGPWNIYGHSIMLPNNHITLRHTATAILLNSYDLLCGIDSQIINMGYVLKELSNNVNILEYQYTGDNPVSGYLLDELQVTLRIDLSRPLELIIADITKLHTAWTKNRINPDRINELDIDQVDQSVSYSALLRKLKSFPNISFSVSAHAARALGFWLWENTDYNGHFKSVREAIDSINDENFFPDDMLHVFGYDESDITVFNRLRTLTRKCVEHKEVMTMG